MPALDINGGDPCSLFNTNTTLWIPSGTAASTAFPLIVGSGAPISFLSVLGNPTGTLLKSLQPQSSFNLIQFLSGGTISAATGTDYTQISNVLLSQNGHYEGIIDTYIVGAGALNKGAGYTFSTTESPLLTPGDFTTIVNKLILAGYLIQSSELYNPSEFAVQQSNPSPGTESLIYLYRLSQTGSHNLSDNQQTRMAMLEAKNLRFYGAFLAEYCFYRSRYEWLLQQYFTIYLQQSSGYTAPSNNDPAMQLFSGTGTADNQYTASPLTQADYLKGLAYHLACLNTRVTDMRMLLSEMDKYYGKVYLTIQNTINDNSAIGSNMDLANKINALQSSTKQAQKYLTEKEFHQGVMEYNSEKNRYSNILLGLYAFLNIAAVAMVIHISQ